VSDSKREAVIAVLEDFKRAVARCIADGKGYGYSEYADRILAAVEPRVLDEQVCYVDDFGQVMATFMNRDPANPLPHNTKRRVALVDLGEVT